MKFLIYSLFAFLCATALQAHAADSGGYGHGNGGDICEYRFNTVRDDLQNWIVKGGSADLQLPLGISLEKYNQEMLKKIRTAKVSCVDKKVFIGGAEKTCKNFVTAKGTSRIQCNIERFMATSDSDQYILVHHEYAGLAGFEVNAGESSTYAISRQITGYLENQTVKKLVVKTSSAGYLENPFSSSSCVGPQMKVQEAKRLIPEGAREIELPTFDAYTLERRCENPKGCGEWNPIETEISHFDSRNIRTFDLIPGTGTIKFEKMSENGVAIRLFTENHARSGYGVSLSCAATGNEEFSGKCFIKGSDGAEIGEAYGIIAANCARLMFLETGYKDNTYIERRVIFTAIY